MLRGLLVHHRGISIWKIGRASIGMEISSVTEPTIINLGKQCAETKEYIFFYSPPLLPPLPFAPVSNHVRMHHERVKLQTTRVHVQRAKYDLPIFLPFFYFLLCLPLPPPPFPIFHLPLSCSLQQWVLVRARNLCSTAHKSWKAGTVRNPW